MMRPGILDAVWVGCQASVLLALATAGCHITAGYRATDGSPPDIVEPSTVSDLLEDGPRDMAASDRPTDQGALDGTLDGALDGALDGTLDGTLDGVLDWAMEQTADQGLVLPDASTCAGACATIETCTECGCLDASPASCVAGSGPAPGDLQSTINDGALYGYQACRARIQVLLSGAFACGAPVRDWVVTYQWARWSSCVFFTNACP